MSQTPPNSFTISKRRLMLYKAIQEFPDNMRIRNALLRTYDAHNIQIAAQHGVYINYSRVDELFALELDTELRQTDVNVWLDQIDIDPDEDWDYAVSNALNRCGVMVFVLSPHALDDEELWREAGVFLEMGKVVIPVIHEACDTSELDLIMPPIDFSESFEMGLQLLLQGVLGKLQATI